MQYFSLHKWQSLIYITMDEKAIHPHLSETYLVIFLHAAFVLLRFRLAEKWDEVTNKSPMFLMRATVSSMLSFCRMLKSSLDWTIHLARSQMHISSNWKTVWCKLKVLYRKRCLTITLFEVWFLIRSCARGWVNKVSNNSTIIFQNCTGWQIIQKVIMIKPKMYLIKSSGCLKYYVSQHS